MIGLCGSVPEAMQVFFRNTVGLLFSFLLGYTSSFLLVRQEKFYEAMYEESAVLTQLLEEAPLLLQSKELLVLLRNTRLYLASSTWRNAKLEVFQRPSSLSRGASSPRSWWLAHCVPIRTRSKRSLGS